MYYTFYHSSVMLTLNFNYVKLVQLSNTDEKGKLVKEGYRNIYINTHDGKEYILQFRNESEAREEMNNLLRFLNAGGLGE